MPAGAAAGASRRSRWSALGVVPLALLVVFYASQLDLGPGGVAHTALLLLAGGRIGLAGAVLWSVAFGCLAAALLVALAPGGVGEDDADEPHEWPDDREPIKIRGPLSYAGPGRWAAPSPRCDGDTASLSELSASPASAPGSLV